MPSRMGYRVYDPFGNVLDCGCDGVMVSDNFIDCFMADKMI